MTTPTLTKDQVLALAREAGLIGNWTDGWKEYKRFSLDNPSDHIEASLASFAALIADATREEDAKVCDVTPPHPFRPSIEAAHAIRAQIGKEST